MSLFTAVLVVELPAIVPGDAAKQVQPNFMLVLPHGDPSKLPKNVLAFCFPDLEYLQRTAAFQYEHSAEEYTFTLTPKDEPRVHGFCRRYRVGAPGTQGRLDLTPFTSADAKDRASPSYQCICILSEKPYQRFFSQCLQLLHAARMAGGPVAMQLARALCSFNGAPPGAILPLRKLVNVTQVPGCMQYPRERLRVPPAVGLQYFDVPISPLLTRLDWQALTMLYAALLSERRILFVSQSIPTLTACVHAAMALFQPFEWQNIFIPVLSSSFLPYCCAPNPYVIGLTPAQFTLLVESYDVGEVVLVSLDDGYVAALNGSQPLVDLEGPSSAGGQGMGAYVASGVLGGAPPPGSGLLVYSGPRLSQDKAMAMATGQIPMPSSGMSAFFSSLGNSLGSPGPHTGPASGSSSRGGGHHPDAASVAAAADAALGPIHFFQRTHAYDDEVVLARAHRRVYVQKRAAARQRIRQLIRKLYGRPAPGGGAAAAAPRADEPPATPRRGAPSSSDQDAIDVAQIQEEAGVTSLEVDLRHLTTRVGEDDSIARRRAAAARRAIASPPDVSYDLAGVTRAGGGGGINGGTGFGPGGAAAGGAAGGATSATGKMGQLMMGAMGKALAMAKQAGSSGASSGAGAAAAGANTAAAIPAPTTDCPAARLVYEVRQVYARERKEGCFDEVAVLAAFLAFVGCVFGRVADFVTVDGAVDAGPSAAAALAAGAEPRFAKEEFLRFTARHPSILRLLEEAVQSQWLQVWATEKFARDAKVAAGAAPPEPTTHGIHVADQLVKDAIASTGTGAGQGTYGASAGYGSTSGSGGGSTFGRLSAGAGGGGPGSGAAALVAAPNFSYVQRRVLSTLTALVDPVYDVPSNYGGAGQGVAGSQHSVLSACEGLAYVAGCVTAFNGRPPTLPASLPEAPPVIVAAALRALLLAATSSGPVLEVPLSTVARIAAAASHDPYLIHVVLGVLWYRLNDCSDKLWQHGYRSLVLVTALLRLGSPRLLPLLLPWLPLVRYLCHPTRTWALRAGVAAEEMAAAAATAPTIAAANVVAKMRKTVHGTVVAPGLSFMQGTNPLSALSVREGEHMLSRQASRVYLLLVSPRRWLTDRALAVGPAAVMAGATLAHPFPLPLTPTPCLTAPTSASLPPGWFPSAQEPAVPASFWASKGLAGPPAPEGPPPVQRQVRAADAPWDQVHKVCTPGMASSCSSALATLAAKVGTSLPAAIKRPAAVAAAIREAQAHGGLPAGAGAGPRGSAPAVRSLRDALKVPKGAALAPAPAPAPAPAGAAAAPAPGPALALEELDSTPNSSSGVVTADVLGLHTPPKAPAPAPAPAAAERLAVAAGPGVAAGLRASGAAPGAGFETPAQSAAAQGTGFAVRAAAAGAPVANLFPAAAVPAPAPAPVAPPPAPAPEPQAPAVAPGTFDFASSGEDSGPAVAPVELEVSFAPAPAPAAAPAKDAAASATGASPVAAHEAAASATLVDFSAAATAGAATRRASSDAGHSRAASAPAAVAASTAAPAPAPAAAAVKATAAATPAKPSPALPPVGLPDAVRAAVISSLPPPDMGPSMGMGMGGGMMPRPFMPPHPQQMGGGHHGMMPPATAYLPAAVAEKLAAVAAPKPAPAPGGDDPFGLGPAPAAAAPAADAFSFNFGGPAAPAAPAPGDAFGNADAFSFDGASAVAKPPAKVAGDPFALF